MDREHTESCQKGVGGVLGEKGEEIKQNPLINRQQYGDYRAPEGKGRGRGRRG